MAGRPKKEKLVKDTLHRFAVPVTREGLLELHALAKSKEDASMGKLIGEAIEGYFGIKILPPEQQEEGA